MYLRRVHDMDTFQMESCVRGYSNMVFTHVRTRAYTNCSLLKYFRAFNFHHLRKISRSTVYKCTCTCMWVCVCISLCVCCVLCVTSYYVQCPATVWSLWLLFLTWVLLDINASIFTGNVHPYTYKHENSWKSQDTHVYSYVTTWGHVVFSLLVLPDLVSTNAFLFSKRNWALSIVQWVLCNWAFAWKPFRHWAWYTWVYA